MKTICREISLKKEELIDETILPTQLETEETTPHPPTPEDELLKSELCDSYSNSKQPTLVAFFISFLLILARRKVSDGR